jgi:hypothetical protein
VLVFNVGVRSQSARAAWLARVKEAEAARLARFPVTHASAAGLGTARQRGGGSLFGTVAHVVGKPGDVEAPMFSRNKREPSFYQGLF